MHQAGYVKLLLKISHFLMEIELLQYKRVKLNNGTYLYWVWEDSEKLQGRFLRQELFAIKNQIAKWIQILFTLKK